MTFAPKQKGSLRKLAAVLALSAGVVAFSAPAEARWGGFGGGFHGGWGGGFRGFHGGWGGGWGWGHHHHGGGWGGALAAGLITGAAVGALAYPYYGYGYGYGHPYYGGYYPVAYGAYDYPYYGGCAIVTRRFIDHWGRLHITHYQTC